MNNFSSFCRMKFHIGEEIRKVFKKRGWTIEFFAEKVNMTPRNASYLFKRNDISILQLQEISRAMDYDFVKSFLLNQTNGFQTNEPEVPYPSLPQDFISMSLSLNIQSRGDNYDNLPELLKKLRAFAEEMGYKIV